MLKLSKKNRGFTLIEVMVAVVVLGIGISAILGLIGKTTAAVSVAKIATIQASLADTTMTEIESMYWHKRAEEIETTGDYGEEFPDYTYEIFIDEEIDQESTDLQQVKVTVYYNAVNPPREFSLTTFLIDFSL